MSTSTLPELKHDAELVQSIPGTGNRALAQCLAYTGDVRRIKSANALAAFISVTPKQKQSGISINGRTMTLKAGHTAARKSLYMPGTVANRHNPVGIARAKRLEQRDLAPKAIGGREHAKARAFDRWRDPVRAAVQG